jgi:hypothetical protein
MNEYYCPLSKIFVGFVGEGEAIEAQSELVQLGTCRGCTYFAKHDQLVTIHILAGKFTIDSCTAVEKE